jgi:Pyruvate/2-oxoacid:ferredoxin oxidoreductase delta subunit
MTLVDGKVVIDYAKSIRCYCCQELCPENAVALKEGKLLKVLKKQRRGKKRN